MLQIISVQHLSYLLSWKQGGLSVSAVTVPLSFGCTSRQDDNLSMKCYLKIHNGLGGYQ